jgi:glucose-1-phosphate cytidylyltransferase
MKVAILAGGLGTRLQEETIVKPKPMVEVGGRPILWHIMKHYAHFSHKEFVLALGYKGEMIKDYFLNYRAHASNVTVSLADGSVTVADGSSEDWTVHLLDTGLDSMTGGRVRRILKHIGRETVMMTYGDGVADVDLGALLAFHRSQGRLATVTAVRPPARFGAITLDGNAVGRFQEKPQLGEGWINGGYFVLEPGVIDYIAGDESVFEREPLERLAHDRQLTAFRHEGFWQGMDTLRDVRLLESLWSDGTAPWRTWA